MHRVGEEYILGKPLYYTKTSVPDATNNTQDASYSSSPQTN